MLDIQDSVAVITGGASGIGFIFARHWLGLGGKAVLADICEEGLKKGADSLTGEFFTVRCDVTSEKDTSRVADLAIERFDRIDMVAPFAGIIDDGLFLDTDRATGKVKKKMSLDRFQRVIDINLTGVFLTVRECAQRMIDHNCRGLICLVSSTGSLGTAGQLNYSASKAAVSVMPKVLTAEFMRRGLSDRIRCVAIAPGYVRTPILDNMNKQALTRILAEVPTGRLIEPEEVASLAAELFRNESCSGETYFIHGGLRLGSKG